MAANTSGVATAFAINIGLALIVFFLFSWLRVKAWAKRFYAPKRFDPTVTCKPRRLPPGLFGWISVIYTYPEPEVVRVAGLDSAMYVRVLQFGWEVFVKISFVVLIIILPINVTGDRVSGLLNQQIQPSPPPAPPPPLGCDAADAGDVKPKEYKFSTFDRLSLANIPDGSPKMWAHMICIYIITYIVLSALWRYNKQATLMRLAYLANAPRGGPSHTVLITDIPGMRHGTIIWYLRQFVGSTLFIMLPASVKQKVLDTMEDGFNLVNHLDVTKVIAPGHNGNFDESNTSISTSGSKVMDAYTKTAKQNSAYAAELEAARQKRATGVIARARRGPEVSADDESLDPWKQAGEVLGSMNDPAADKVKGFIHEEVEFCYGKGCVAAVNPVWDQSQLDPLLAEYNDIKQKLEDHIDDMEAKLKRRKTIKKKLQVTVVPALLGAWGTEKYGLKPVKVDAMDYWVARLAYLAEQIPSAQEVCLQKAIPAAFVTVENRKTQVTMCTALHHHDEGTWQIQGAPEPKEIIWASLAMRKWQRTVRSVLIWAAYFALMFFYLIPIAAMQALIEVPKLATVPVLGDIVNAPFIKQLIEAILPGLVLLIFLALLPTLLAFMGRLAGLVSISQVDFSVVTRYFWFQVVTIFVGSIIAGSLLSQLTQFIQNPQSIISILGVAIPTTSSFFINFILVTGIGKTGIKHMRIPGLVIFWLLSKIAATPRARARLWADQYTLYGPTVAYHTMNFLLGCVYCCINPIIAPVCVVYFSFALISERYNNLYVFKRAYESGGRLWYTVFNQFVVCLYFMQVVMIILLSINKFKAVFFLIPAPFITFFFHITCLAMFHRPWTVTSAHDASHLDLLDQQERGGQALSYDELNQIQDMYLSPVFKVRQEDVDDLLHEAEKTKRRLNGEKLEDIEVALEDASYHSAGEEEGVDILPDLPSDFSKDPSGKSKTADGLAPVKTMPAAMTPSKSGTALNRPASISSPGVGPAGTETIPSVIDGTVRSTQARPTSMSLPGTPPAAARASPSSSSSNSPTLPLSVSASIREDLGLPTTATITPFNSPPQTGRTQP